MLSGLDSSGDYFVTLLTDTFAGSGGARARRDGVDLGGEIPNVVSRWANVETQELHTPMLYLYRRPVPDSGGPGKYRGGVSHEFAFSAHDSAAGQIGVGLSAKGLGVPMSTGLFGGYPGCNIGITRFKPGNRDQFPEDYDSTQGAPEVLQWGEFELGSEDIQYLRFMGGGGYGDPIDRDPQATANDVAQRLVSARAAFEIYGVVLERAPGNDGQDVDSAFEVDAVATAGRRAVIRQGRLGKAVAEHLAVRKDVADSGRSIGEYLQQASNGIQCTWCGEVVAAGGERWKDRAVRKEVSLLEAGRFRESVDGMVLRQFYCPNCATILDSEVVLEQDPPLYDDVRSWPDHA
jgi:N-methylhydantoinase B